MLNMKKNNIIFWICVLLLIVIFMATFFIVQHSISKPTTSNKLNEISKNNIANNNEIFVNNTIETSDGNLESNDSYYGYSLNSGYIRNMLSRQWIIKQYSDLKEFCNQYNNYIYDGYGNIKSGTLDVLLTKYNDKFFENQSLAIIYVGLSSGSYKVEFVNATKVGNGVNIKYNIKHPLSGIGTMDMSGYLVIVEVDSDIDYIM